MRTVIIPAAGKATRFGGVLKELLPISKTETALMRAVKNAVASMKATDICIITNKEKVSEHMAALTSLPVTYKEQVYNTDLWGAILSGLSAVDGGLIMPDTITDIPIMTTSAPLSFGLFTTHEPERFSILHNNTIITKQKIVDNNTVYKAWGVVLWNADVAAYWIKHGNYLHYDDAFRDAMIHFGFTVFDLPYYYDIGTFDAYTQYIKDIA